MEKTLSPAQANTAHKLALFTGSHWAVVLSENDVIGKTKNEIEKITRNLEVPYWNTEEYSPDIDIHGNVVGYSEHYSIYWYVSSGGDVSLYILSPKLYTPIISARIYRQDSSFIFRGEITKCDTSEVMPSHLKVLNKFMENLLDTSPDTMVKYRDEIENLGDFAEVNKDKSIEKVTSSIPVEDIRDISKVIKILLEMDYTNSTPDFAAKKEKILSICQELEGK